MQNFLGSNNSSNLYHDICTYGTFFNPASRHYGMHDANVICDRCRRQYLDVCIGYGSRDLCLQCVQEVTRQIQSPLPRRLEIPRTYDLDSRHLDAPTEGYRKAILPFGGRDYYIGDSIPPPSYGISRQSHSFSSSEDLPRFMN